MFKKSIFTLILMVLIILILPVFLSSKFSMSRSIEINAPVAVVFSKLTDLKEYNKWNPFPDGDETHKTNITGDGIGSSLSWVGKKTGEGKMTIVAIEPNKNINLKMEFYKPMAGEGMVRWILNSKSDSITEMQWTFDQDLSYFKRYFGLMMDTIMGKPFEKGLKNYKNLIEGLK